MSTFVLVHGAWQGASTWDLIVPQLQRSGHQVFTPVLTGLGADSHRLSRAVSLDTHIDDVTRILESENLQKVTLVGHSYAGMVITAVAETGNGRVSRLVYADAFIPGSGESALDLLPENIREAFRNQARTNGEGWRLPATEGLLDLWGLQPGDARRYVQERLCDFSLRCFEQKVQLPSNAAARLPRTFIAAIGHNYPARPVFEQFAQKARREGWDYRELATGHDCHVEAPEAFASFLLEKRDPDSDREQGPIGEQPEALDPTASHLLRDQLKGQTTQHATPPRLEDEGQSGG
jgi:pimeloyl-ACP methyl ester carboxylesterase